MFEDGVGIAEGLELEGVARRIEEEESPLLAWLALEADLWLHDEGMGGTTEAVDQAIPGVPREHGAEMVERHHVIADLRAGGGFGIIVDVCGELVAEEVEIDPVLGLAPDLAADDLAIEISGAFFVLHCEGHVKWDHLAGPRG